jgi:hypothetical protein
MPTRDAAPLGAPCWTDLSTTDADRAREFYGELFGWSADEPAPEFGGYFNFTKNGALVAGCMASQPGVGFPNVWAVHLATADARKTMDAAVSNGGQVAVPPMQVGDLGTMSVLVDPGGASVGAWQPHLFPGFRILGEPGTPQWFELRTRDYEAVVAFYKSVFGWGTHAVSGSPEFGYTVLQYGEDRLAGVMDASGSLAGAASRWSVFFGAEDADAASASIDKLGGRVLRPAWDSPYGRLAVVADPMGAEFTVLEAN